MRHPGLLLAILIPLAPCAPLRAQAPAEDAPARARELLKRLDAALEPLRGGAYAEMDRRPIADILARLRVQAAALQPPPGAQAPPARAEALLRFEKDVVEALRREEDFLKAAGPASSARFQAETAAPLKRDAVELAAAFARLFPEASPGAASLAVPPPVRRATAAADAASRAAAGGKAAKANPRLFYDGGAAGAGGALKPGGAAASNRRARRYTATGGVVTQSVPRLSDLTLGPVPAPERSASETACRQASGGGLPGLCGSRLTAWSAPMSAGVVDAFKEQFGTVSGVVSLLAFTALGFLLSALSGGVGLVVTLLKALCGIALVWMAGSMLYRLAAAIKEFATTSADDPRHWAALRTIGKVGGELLILALMAFAGYKLGQKPAVKNAAASMTKTLQGQMGRLGIRPKPAAPELRAAFGEPLAARAPAAAQVAPAASRFEVAAGKWNYFFGRVKARITKDMSKTQIEHQMGNELRSAQIARVLKANGIEDTPAGRERLTALFGRAMSAPAIGEAKLTPYGFSELKAVKLPNATLEVAFFHPQGAPGRVEVTTIIPKEHRLPK